MAWNARLQNLHNQMEQELVRANAHAIGAPSHSTFYGGGKKGGQGAKGDAANGKGGKGMVIQPPPQKCKHCAKTNHPHASCRHKDKDCSNCGKNGHIAAACHAPINARVLRSQTMR